MSARTWKLFVRKPDGTREAELDDYSSAKVTPKFNDVGEWTVSLPVEIARRVAAGGNENPALLLAQPRWGLEVEADGEVVFSGPTITRKRSRRGGVDSFEIGGADDAVWLSRRLVHPQPSTPAPQYNTDDYDDQSGPGSTVMIHYVNVNAGPGALTQRQVTGLTMAPDLVLGSSIQMNGRWQPLLEITQQAALAADLGFRIRDLTFEVFQPGDKTSTIRFDADLGTLGDFEYSDADPESNYIVVGGGGEGIARVIVERQDATSVAGYGRIESFRDRRDTTDPTELSQAGDTELIDKTSRTGMSLTPVEAGNQRWRDDYDLGDKVTAVIDGVAFVERIRQVAIVIEGGGETITPAIGVPEAYDPKAMFNSLRRRADRRLTDLERI